MGISRKLGLCLASVFLLCLLTGVVGWLGVRELSRQLDESIRVTTRKIELAARFKGNAITFRLQERGLLLFGFGKLEQNAKASSEAYDKAMAAAYANLEEMRPLVDGQAERAEVEAAKTGVDEYRMHQLEVRALLAQGKLEEATAWDGKYLAKIGGRIAAAADNLAELQHKANAEAAQQSEQVRRRAQIWIGLCLFSILPVGAIIVLVVRRMMGRLTRLGGQLNVAGRDVEGAAGQIATSSQTLADGASRQAASAEETSATGLQIGTMARKNAESAGNAEKLVRLMEKKFGDTTAFLAEMVTAMEEIRSASAKVGGVAKAIDGIAFQTNILALNAAVEAARAGETGAGFAVVADEVRSLAQRSAAAAREATGLIESSMQTTNGGREKVVRLVESIDTMTVDVKEIGRLIADVRAGSKQQVDGVGTIGKAIVQIERVSQGAAASAEECAAASADLQGRSRDLREVVAQLGEIVGNG